MKIAEVIQHLQQIAPENYQENYDNAGLLTGDENSDCTGILCTLDCTEEIVDEAMENGCNLVVAHHPIVFSGLKKITGKNYVERTIIKAIKNDIAIYAIHTNLDNVLPGVNNMIADKLGLINRKILAPKTSLLQKLYTFVPVERAEKIRSAIFKAGAGFIGNYSECSFNSPGTGTFKPGDNTNPFVGKTGERHQEQEIKMEFIFPVYLQNQIIQALIQAHPYEEVAYDIVALQNEFTTIGSGLLANLPQSVETIAFLQQLKDAFGLNVIKHTKINKLSVSTVALCGGAGFFLLKNAIRAKADIYITSDVKYHEFFDADGRIILADIGHYESEQFTIQLLHEILQAKFPNFAVLKTKLNTNPVQYFL